MMVSNNTQTVRALVVDLGDTLLDNSSLAFKQALNEMNGAIPAHALDPQAWFNSMPFQEAMCRPTKHSTLTSNLATTFAIPQATVKKVLNLNFRYTYANMQFLDQLLVAKQRGVKIFILSNSETTWWKKWYRSLKMGIIFHDTLASCFSKTKSMKPYHDFFDEALDQFLLPHGIPRNRSLLIDDNLTNCEEIRKCRANAYHFTGYEKCYKNILKPVIDTGNVDIGQIFQAS